MSLRSLTQDSLLEDEKGKKEDSLSASLRPSGDNPDEELSDDLSKPRKVHYHSTWKNTQDAAYWINFVRAQDKGLRFWQTRSQPEIVHNSVPTDCIDKVISQKGERTLFERLSTPRPAPKIVIKSAWQSQQQQQPQQQQQDSESGSTRTRKLVRRVQREERERINGIQKRTQNHDAKGNWSEVLSHFLKKKSLEIRIEGVAQRCNLEGRRGNGKNHTSIGKVEKRFTPEIYSARSGNPKNPMTFSEESQPEELKFCGCGVCLRPDEDTINRIKARFQALTAPYYLARVNRSRGRKYGKSQWQKDIGKRWTPRKEPTSETRTPPS